MLMKYIAALSLAAMAASQQLDNCTLSLNLPSNAANDIVFRAFDCLIPGLTHKACHARAQAFRAAFRGPRTESNTNSCTYDVTSGVQLSTDEFLNIPAICAMVGGKIAFPEVSVPRCTSPI